MFKKTLLGLVIAFVIAQFFRPALTNPAVDETRTMQARIAMPAPVRASLERSCNDCHSHKTAWPWYSKVAPVSWLLASDVNGGRRELNLSDWTQYEHKRAAHKLQKICDEVREGDMPLWYYKPLHPNSRLSDTDRAAICSWAEAERAKLGFTKEQVAEHD